MVSQQTVEEYFQLRESLRPFLERKMGLQNDCKLQDAIETIEQLIDFEDHLISNDPEMLDSCAEMVLVAKGMLQQYISKRGGKRYLEESDLKKLEKELEF